MYDGCESSAVLGSGRTSRDFDVSGNVGGDLLATNSEVASFAEHGAGIDERLLRVVGLAKRSLDFGWLGPRSRFEPIMSFKAHLVTSAVG